MQIIDRFTLVDSHRKKDGKMLISRQGEPLSIDVDGLRIEAQFVLHDGRFLVWLTEKCPHDEMLSIYLFNSNGLVDDSVEAGAKFGMGPGGVLEILTYKNNWVEFEFFTDNTISKLKIAPDKKRFRKLPRNWRYKHLLKKHQITVSEIQKEGA